MSKSKQKASYILESARTLAVKVPAMAALSMADKRKMDVEKEKKKADEIASLFYCSSNFGDNSVGTQSEEERTFQETEEEEAATQEKEDEQRLSKQEEGSIPLRCHKGAQKQLELEFARTNSPPHHTQFDDAYAIV